METNYTGLKVATFRERFSELCDSDPHNASAIAEALHVSRQTVSAWKSGFRSPKEPTIIAIAHHFHVTVPWLMGFDVERQENETPALAISPDSKGFGKILAYMSNYCFEDYKTVVDILNRTYEKMRKEGIDL